MLVVDVAADAVVVVSAVVVVVGGTVVVVVAAAVVLVDGAPAFAGRIRLDARSSPQVPPKAATPSPWVWPGAVSFTKV